jgi:hypothetical protein
MTITDRAAWLGGAFALVFLLSACGGSQSDGGVKSTTLTDQPEVVYEEPADDKGDKAAGPALEPHLEFSEMVLYDGTTPVLKVHADGSTELGKRTGDPKAKPPKVTWEAGPLVKADGTLVYKEQNVARVHPDGSMVNLLTNEPLPVKVHADTVMSNQNGKEIGLALAEDGSISLVGQAAPATGKPVMKLEGASTAGQRKTALAIMGAILLSGGK